MARMETVYFSEIHPEKWFKTWKEAEEYDQYIEMVDHAFITLCERYERDFISDVIKSLSDRYKIEQRWDWPSPTSKEILANEKANPPEDIL